MLGAVAGDIIGSVYEFQPIKTIEFPLFGEESRLTDDTVLTVAVADSLLTGKSYAAAIKQWGRKYPQAGYGKNFYQWLMSRCSVAYESWGNGSAMRVSPVGWAFDTLEQTLKEAYKSAEITHNHPEGIKGAQVVAGAIFMCRQGASKEDVKEWISSFAGYNLQRTIENIRPGYRFEVSCQASVPEAIICFLESNNVEEAIRLAVSLGGDADTQACISGAIAHAFYGTLPEVISKEAENRLPDEMKKVLQGFKAKYL
ncbi:ADP-ribosylglycohydrolase family protein [Nafulsella turpanensis]|uniref:ADP-ribosylglycohydrolase family protein n=1 Tax=Nafulsella turpanensis TaxID=1265690 RepID=UPI000345347D|nr:ADP-ribosylglycohydrolase family protein [Nafulsella turpanensis]